MTTVITVDDDGVSVLLAALDLYQRVAMGQWRDIPAVADGVLTPDQVGPWTPAAEELEAIRCRYAVPALTDPRASLGIAAAHPGAQVAYDLWHALGGGMESRRNDRLTRIEITVERPSAAARPDRPTTPAIIVLRGLPGAGKSTWATGYVRDVRAEGRWAGVVSRDTVREHFMGLTMTRYDAVLDPAGEAVVTAVVEAAAVALLAAGCDVVADATHLSSRDVTRWQAIAAAHGATVRVVDLRVPAEECIRRDAGRAASGGRSVGAAVIRQMAAAARPTYGDAL